MEISTLTEQEIMEYLQRGLINQVPADIAIKLIKYYHWLGYRSGVEDERECWKDGY